MTRPVARSWSNVLPSSLARLGEAVSLFRISVLRVISSDRILTRDQICFSRTIIESYCQAVNRLRQPARQTQATGTAPCCVQTIGWRG